MRSRPRCHGGWLQALAVLLRDPDPGSGPASGGGGGVKGWWLTLCCWMPPCVWLVCCSSPLTALKISFEKPPAAASVQQERRDKGEKKILKYTLVYSRDVMISKCHLIILPQKRVHGKIASFFFKDEDLEKSTVGFFFFIQQLKFKRYNMCNKSAVAVF